MLAKPASEPGELPGTAKLYLKEGHS